jgi:hypothetical protein
MEQRAAEVEAADVRSTVRTLIAIMIVLLVAIAHAYARKASHHI